jgi:hypothetical protein
MMVCVFGERMDRGVVDRDSIGCEWCSRNSILGLERRGEGTKRI